MKNLIRNVASVIGGVVIGSIINMSIVNIGMRVVPLPEGADVSTVEKMAESMKLFTPANFLFPFLAHALGTLAGALIAARFAASHKLKCGVSVGIFFLVAGIAAVSMFGGPLWFKVTDLLLAYLPMAFIGAKLAGKSAAARSATAV